MEKLLIFLGVIGLFFFLMRRGGSGMGCCGGGHSHGEPSEPPEEKSKGHSQTKEIEKKPSGSEGSGCH